MQQETAVDVLILIHRRRGKTRDQSSSSPRETTSAIGEHQFCLARDASTNTLTRRENDRQKESEDNGSEQKEDGKDSERQEIDKWCNGGTHCGGHKREEMHKSERQFDRRDVTHKQRP